MNGTNIVRSILKEIRHILSLQTGDYCFWNFEQDKTKMQSIQRVFNFVFRLELDFHLITYARDRTGHYGDNCPPTKAFCFYLNVFNNFLWAPKEKISIIL